jgi:hypothetical protein
MNSQLDQLNNLSGKKAMIVAVIVLGSLAGFIEIVLSGFLKWANFPWTSGLLVGLGLGIIAFAYAIFKKPLMAIGIGLVAVLCRQMAIPILGLSEICKMNSCVAVLLEYSALAAIASITMKKMESGRNWRVLTGASAAVVGSLAFYYIGMRVAPCNYLLSFNSGAGFLSYLYKESLNWTILSAALVPLGWFLGEKLTARVSSLSTAKPRKFYAGAYGVALACWVICAIAIASGI